MHYTICVPKLHVLVERATISCFLLQLLIYLVLFPCSWLCVMSHITTRLEPFIVSDEIWVESPLIDLIHYHPYFRINESTIPEWLLDYGLIRFTGYDSTRRETKLVHRLYYGMFTNDEDRDMVKPNMAMGETIAMVSSPPTRDIVCALTYFQIDGTVIVFFLATKVTMQVMGLAQLLLRLLLRRARHVYRDRDDDIVLYLFANPGKNEDAWNWYKKRGFQVLENLPTFSPNIRAAFHNHDVQEMQTYLTAKESLQWLSKTLDETSDYQLVETDIMEKMFVNPYALWPPNVYAMLPSHVSLHELDKCMPTSKVKAIQRLFALPKQIGKKETSLDTDTNLLIPDGYYQTVYVTWVSRTFQKSGSNLFDVDMLDLSLVWSQRHFASTRLIDHIFIIPSYIMTQATSMYVRYCSYLQSREVTEIAFNEFEEMEFMECVPIVMKYLFEKIMFLKATYIACLTQDLDDSWSCLIHVNKQDNDEATHISGYYRCDPTNPSRNKVLLPQWPFFLKLASMVQEEFAPATASTYASAEKVNFKLFASLEDFHIMMQNYYDYFGENAIWFPKQIPKEYSDDKFCCASLTTVSDVKALMFLLDFLRCLEYSKDRQSLGFKRNMGKDISKIKTQKQMMNVVVEMQRGKIELIDKLSETQLGESRRKAKEYKERILGFEKFPSCDFTYGDQVSGQWLGHRKRYQETALKSTAKSVAALKKDTTVSTNTLPPAKSIDTLKKDTTVSTSTLPSKSIDSSKKNTTVSTSTLPPKSIDTLKKGTEVVVLSDTSDEDSNSGAEFPQKLKKKLGNLKKKNKLGNLSNVVEKNSNINKGKPKKKDEHEKDSSMVVERNENEPKKKHASDDAERKATNETMGQAKMKPKESPMTDVREDTDVSGDADIVRKRKRKNRQSEPNHQQSKRDIECWESTDIAPVASLFKDEYRSLRTEGERRKLERKIFWILQEREKIESIEQSMNNIHDTLLPEQSDIAEIPEKKCPEHLRIFETTKPHLYRTITEQFKNKYIAARDDIEIRKEIVENIGVSLHSYGFRFFAGKPEDKPARKMELNKTLTMIDLRMKRLCNKKEPWPREVEENDENEDDNDDEIGPFTAGGEPTSKCIVSGQGGKKRKANVFLQQQLQSNLDTYRMFSFAHEKTKIHIEIRNNVHDAGYFFVSRDKQTGLWSKDKDKEASEKIRNAFRHILNPRQRIKEEEDHDAIGPLTEDGKPTSKAILPGTHNRKANAFYRACLMTRMQEYEQAQTTEQQRDIRNEVKIAIAEAGYFFLERDKETNAWSQLSEKDVGKKIRTTFTFLLNAKKVGKPKVEEEEGVATKVADNEMKKHMVVVDKEVNDVEHENKQEDEVLTQIVRDKQDTLVDNAVLVEIDSEESNVENTGCKSRD